MQDNIFNKNNLINCGGKLLDLSHPIVMGILNITPDSFFDGGKFTEEEAIVKQVNQMIFEGASVIDVGASSARPGAREITAKDEISNLIPILSLLTQTFPETIFSVDTVHSQTAEKAVEKGAQIINDISGGTMDESMFEVVAALQVPYILMHMKGTPKDMQFNPSYANVTAEVMDYFTLKIEKLRNLHVHDIILDPGFGFGKTTEHNYQLINRLNDFKIFGMPIMVGISRKSMIGKVLEKKPVESLNGTTVLHVLALQQGANMLRVHDVREAMEAIKLVTFANEVKGKTLND